MSSDHTIRTEVRLSGSIPATFIMGKDLDGIYIGGDFQGVAQGWYDSNLPGMVPTGLWDASGNRTDANGWYQDNLKVTLTNGLWVAEIYQGEANGWYQNNLPATMDNGLWIANSYIGMVNGWYVNNVRTTLTNGLWAGEIYQGEANGWYVDNAPAVMATGIWEGNDFREIATGLYDNNVKLPFDSGLYVDEVFKGAATGYYVENVKTNIPDGCYRNGGLVDPYYERIRDAALAQGGGLYLFQLEHGHYAGEQVIWQEMGELTPWVPELLTPQGKTYDLMGSGEYLGQSVSMRRPVDGVWDGVGTWLDASSDAVGGHLHQAKPSGAIAGLEILSEPMSRVFWATKTSTSTNVGDGMLLRGHTAGGLVQFVSIGSGIQPYTLGVPSLDILADGQKHYAGVINSGSDVAAYADGLVSNPLSYASYADVPALDVLRVGANTAGSALLHAKIDYIAIYTREPTPYEISLHKRTP